MGGGDDDEPTQIQTVKNSETRPSLDKVPVHSNVGFAVNLTKNTKEELRSS
jgi:hypothetical protein